MSLSDILSKNLGVELSPIWQDKKATGRRGLPLDEWLPLRLVPAVRMKSRRVSALDEDSRVVPLETVCASRLVTAASGDAYTVPWHWSPRTSTF